MTDRELLKAAAKASGMTVEADGIHSFDDWNPLTNDGDAFRLAVKLGITVAFAKNYERVIAMSPVGAEILGTTNDLFADARRAIVEAAATMGKDYKA